MANKFKFPLIELSSTRADVKRRVDEAENNPIKLMKRTSQVDRWLHSVGKVEDEVVRVIQPKAADDEIQAGRCFGCNWNANARKKNKKLVIRKLLSIMEELQREGDSFVDVAYKLPPRSVQEENMGLTVGMESMFDKVWRLLAEDEVRIMGLYGDEGVGKTTLLKQINNEFLKTTTMSFDIVIVVVVSKVINIDAIKETIGYRLGLSSPNEENIRNFLSKKNFLLLLDDIWERVDLQSIGIPPPNHENTKSKVVFTTRSEIVCEHMDANTKFRVECLQWDKAWALFQQKVGKEALNSDPYNLELAKDVARECDGLPLALITIDKCIPVRL